MTSPPGEATGLRARVCLIPILAVLVCLLLPYDTVHAVINAALQPVDLYRRHNAVVVGEVAGLDPETKLLEVRVTKVYKGEYEAGSRITIAAEGPMEKRLAHAAEKGTLRAGSGFVAFVGKRRPKRHRKDLLFYTDIKFGVGTMETPDRWRWFDDDKEEIGIALGGEKPEAVSTLGGTWNGSTGKLIELVDDISRGEAYFPRKAYCRFKPDMLLARLDGPVRGVALYDINGDDLLDVCACSDAGNRMYFQAKGEDGGMAFAEMTEYLRVEDVASPSCSFADVDADGWTDYLAGGVIYRATLEGEEIHFAASESLPAEAAVRLKSSAFVELDGDGYPDVVVSIEDGGLRAYLNPGAEGGAFRDATEAMGLDREENGAGLNGFFAPGDWNGDDRTDLFYGAGRGFLLVQSEEGRFAAVAHEIEFDFTSGEERVPGLTGAGFFAPIVDPARPDLVVPYETGWHLVTNRDGVPVDVSVYAGEITEGSYLHLASIAEDLNLDGYVDYYTTSRAASGHNRFIINRGYGSFMHSVPHRYYGHMFEGPAQELGGWGAVAGDVDSDGAPDILLGNAHGHLVLILNETLELRKPVEHPIDDVQRLLKVRTLAVRVKGDLGVLGAKVTLADETGRVVCRRDLGSNVAVGCAGPNTVNLAVREPGEYVLSVRFSDGRRETWEVDLTVDERVAMTARRGEGRAEGEAPAVALDLTEDEAIAGDIEDALAALGATQAEEAEGIEEAEPPPPAPEASGRLVFLVLGLVVLAAAAVVAAFLRRKGSGDKSQPGD